MRHGDDEDGRRGLEAATGTGGEVGDRRRGWLARVWTGDEDGYWKGYDPRRRVARARGSSPRKKKLGRVFFAPDPTAARLASNG